MTIKCYYSFSSCINVYTCRTTLLGTRKCRLSISQYNRISLFTFCKYFVYPIQNYLDNVPKVRGAILIIKIC